MALDAPVTIPGERLKAQRKGYGVTRADLAKHLQVHRNTVLAWESEPALDVIRQRRYLNALRELVDRA